MTHLSTSILTPFPAEPLRKADELLRKELAESKIKWVVLDDDPTGVQTVHDVSVYTDWTEESIRAGFCEDRRLFYLLTNSRAMTESETVRAHREIVRRVARVSGETGIPFLFLSRSDSTLRGHYPLETEILREEMAKTGRAPDGEILCPFFPEGGRFTVGNVHYVRQGEDLVPAAETEFARDPTFGYTKSALPEYIAEKTGGRFPAEQVACISLENLRSMDLDRIESQLMAVSGFGKVCVNAMDYGDLKVFAIALYRAIAKGKIFLFRTAAALVRVLGGVTEKPLLTREEMIVRETEMGGVIVVGSHTRKTTAQLDALLTLPGVVPVAFDSDRVLDGEDAFRAEVDRCVAEEEEIIRSGRTAVCYTRRSLLTLENDTKESALQRSVRISDGVQSLVGKLNVTPAFIIAKGGITSSDVGTKALKVRRATVMGQICPGVPVWQTGSESRFPLTPYVIFPGNTGDENSLRTAADILMNGRRNDK